MRICDGCGVSADDQHLRERIQRLEWATRFRPLHIQALLVADAPPASLEDYFYRPAQDRRQRSAAGQQFFDELARIAATASSIGAELALGDLQRRGLFLTYAVECPVEDSGARAESIASASATLLNRIRLSYRPKHVVLLSEHLRGLIPLLQGAGWGDRLILDGNGPFRLTTEGCPDFEAKGCGERLAAAINGVV